MLGKFFKKLVPAPTRPAVPEGARVYAIGDVHGRADLLGKLLRQIEADHAARPAAQQIVIFLGDLIDRGPASREVVEMARQFAAERKDVHLLKGNHEEVFLQTLEGDAQTMRLFARIGGRETLASYGITEAEFENGSYTELAELAAERVPPEHKRFLDRGKDSMTLGDYLFVHAGVRPDKALAEQTSKDMRWIRGEFLDFEGELEKVVVHGHSIAMEVQEHPHRIGIDTGAFQTGVLTALALEGEDRWFLQAREGEAA
ncbi:metallophosphoesterase family protein [Tsuneonella sp. HG222]